ncbi:MAG TPA: ROK family protein [Terracidiphilus sp.]
MLALSLDMGGTHIGCGVVQDNQLLGSSSLDSERAKSLESLLPFVTAELKKILRETGATPGECHGIAIGFPGIVDVRNGRILSTLKKYEDAIHLDLKQWAIEQFGLRLRMENDARMALLGEQFAGAAQGVQDVVMITLGTGIGGAAMMLGKLVRGAHSQAACLGGHLPVNYRGHKCLCGNVGCAEAEAAGWSLPRIVQETPGFHESSLANVAQLNFQILFAAARNEDAVACEVQLHCLNVWAANAVAQIHAYDPELVVFGGGVMQDADVILTFVQKYVEERAWTSWGTPRVCAAILSGNAALLGAVPLLSEDLRPI